MTIVAGFRVDDGILMCSDTQYTGGAKVHKQKIFTLEISGDAYVFAIAGHEGNAKMAISDCQEAIRHIRKDKRTDKTIQNAIRKSVKPIWDKYVWSRAQTLWDGLAFELLVACWIPNSGGHILMSVGSNGDVNRRDDAECKGTGAYIGQYVIGSYFKSWLSMEAVKVLAANVLWAAKSYDPNCGGPSTFVVLIKSGQCSPIPYDYYGAEVFLLQYEAMAKSLLFYTGNPTIEDKYFEHELTKSVATVRIIREAWNKAAKTHAQLFGVLPQQPNNVFNRP